MARKPRPVNPDDGPLQAFAFDLRALRETAGNPTYRTLAKTAGFAATTLGDAAGGGRLPTLEVTLAYVGACGGDAAAWQARWQAVNRELARRPAPESETEADPESDIPDAAAEPVAEPAATQPAPVAESGLLARLPRTAMLAASTTGLVLVMAAAFLVQHYDGGHGTAGSLSGQASHAAVATQSSVPVGDCPSPVATGGPIRFTANTYGLGANVREGASLQSPVRAQLPPGCTVGFSGYCLGDVVRDETAGTPDMRWFIVPGGGVVSSAIVHGDPPADLRPQACPDDVPGPASISLAVSPDGTGDGVVQLVAGGTRLWIVGFAAYYSSGAPGDVARWHQLELTDGNSMAALSFSATLRISPSTRGLSDPSEIPVVAAACFGGNGPSTVATAGAVRRSAPSILVPMSQPASMLSAAESAACAYPSTTAAG